MFTKIVHKISCCCPFLDERPVWGGGEGWLCFLLTMPSTFCLQHNGRGEERFLHDGFLMVTVLLHGFLVSWEERNKFLPM